MSKASPSSFLSRALRAALLVAVFVSCAFPVVLGVKAFVARAASEGASASVLMSVTQGIALFGGVVLLWHVVLYARYRHVASVRDEELPELTVIVPAYNEGKQVLKTLRSLQASDYPREKLHIVAVDDGSRDDTWTWIERGAREAPDRILALRCLENRGKRAALYEGMARARGEVIVTVDSDSEVLADTLRNLVSPIVRDAKVGAVAGNVRVLNREAGLLPRMLDVSFTFSFQFVRAAQSEVDTVMCCPGALTAYRRSVVDEVKDEWLAQTFFGKPSTIGEDRAMTNLILRKGFTSKFQANAVVRTEVPVNTTQLARMYLRWARSDVRETFVLSRFILKRFRSGSSWGARLIFSWSALRWMLTPVAAAWAITGLAAEPGVLAAVLGGVLASAIMPATLFAHSRSMQGSFWAFPYAVYAFFLLWWIRPYALFTPHKSKWLTRDLPAAPAPVALRIERPTAHVRPAAGAAAMLARVRDSAHGFRAEPARAVTASRAAS
ncbi:MAG: glycosyltransferase family 2 protein [Labilithrix sp.]|nr:glycosyltransferase family 2 protein [Labilithrix sp.]